jgi:hypothetical protein
LNQAFQCPEVNYNFQNSFIQLISLNLEIELLSEMNYYKNNKIQVIEKCWRGESTLVKSNYKNNLSQLVKTNYETLLEAIDEQI